MYCETNFKTKKEMVEAWKAGEHLKFYVPGGMFGTPKFLAEEGTGRIFVEGPHYPEPHKWYAEVQFVDGKIVRIK